MDMRLRISALSLAALACCAPAAAADSGGAGAPAPAVPAGKVGGTAYTSAHINSIAGLSVRSGATPAIRVRFAAVRLRYLDATVIVLRRGGGVVARIRLHRVRANRAIDVRWPSGLALRAGRYVALARAGGFSRRTSFVVPAAHRPRPRPRPVVPVTPTPGRTGVFPVVGPHSYGDAFGAPRKGYSHQGQDVLGAEGLPIVAPLAGTIATTGFQAGAAGYYVVLDAGDGHAYFFAHCEKQSTAVSTGQAVVAGARLCLLGQTGDATGPHLHFEEWVDGWRVGAASHPIDPLPQLMAWDH
jgi:murein DD-endopeptidase MepM/ murein hydrolase activator NlpD